MASSVLDFCSRLLHHLTHLCRKRFVLAPDNLPVSSLVLVEGRKKTGHPGQSNSNATVHDDGSITTVDYTLGAANQHSVFLTFVY
ncbi:hypothetical protein RvY_00627 [Ramazzottius varieornatus]|uniref:Uncharacterized protein n=1 Tax=Ramazzottius varieornatus TaxID=947166 RepID=A0A1D1UH41_RAMVA|nr:hypothetical protein RvY_00627 [Ramazzottius varieornatus]